MRKKIWLAVAVIAIVAITSSLYMFSKPNSGGTPSGQPAGSVNMLKFPVVREDLSNIIEVKGKSSYVKETWVYAPFSGKVNEWLVEDGQQVAAGQALFAMDEEPLRNELSSQQAQIRRLEAERRIREIQEETSTGTVTAIGSEEEAKQRFVQNELRKMQQELDDLSLSQAYKSLQANQEKLDKAVYKAEEDGIFLFAETKKPQAVPENGQLGKLVDLSRLQLVTTVGEFAVFGIKEGMEVEVFVDSQRQRLIRGTVAQVSKFAKPGTDSGNSAAQFEVIVSLESSEQLIAGLSLTGKIVTESRNAALVVPTLGVLRDKNEVYVHVETPEGIQRRVIEIGMETAENTEVLSGLAEGDVVVLQ